MADRYLLENGTDRYLAENGDILALEGVSNLTATAGDSLSTLGESVSRAAAAKTRTDADSIASISESAARGVTAWVRSVAQSVGAISEAPSRAIGLVRTTSATMATLSESVARSVQALLRTTANSVPSLAESAARATVSLGRIASASLDVLSEAIDRAGTFGRTNADSVGSITEAVVGVAASGHVDYVRSTADGLVPFTWGESEWGSGDAYGGISEHVDAILTPAGPTAYVRTVDDDIAAIDEQPLGPAAGATWTGVYAYRIPPYEPVAWSLAAADELEYAYEDATARKTEDEDWVLLGLELTLME